MALRLLRNSQSNWILSGRAGSEFRPRGLAKRILSSHAEQPMASRPRTSQSLTTLIGISQNRSKTSFRCCDCLGRLNMKAPFSSWATCRKANLYASTLASLGATKSREVASPGSSVQNTLSPPPLSPRRKHHCWRASRTHEMSAFFGVGGHSQLPFSSFTPVTESTVLYEHLRL